jgi:hypothetical protein
LLADFMPAVPGRHLYTTFRFRWPWLHNAGFGDWGDPSAIGPSPANGWPIAKGHLQWLDANMPNRNSGS